MKVLVTCPPMVRAIDEFKGRFRDLGWEVVAPQVVQTLSVEELKELLPQFEGWIIGDDPATREVFQAGKKGKLRAAVKWGIGMDNVDFAACKDLGIPIINTPGMFGNEVADYAYGYLLALARETFAIDRGVREGQWPKPAGTSLAGKTVALVGFGDIGRQIARRCLASDLQVIAYDPAFQPQASMPQVENAAWPARLEEADFLILCCALNATNRHMLNAAALAKAKQGLRVINVGRGPLIDESALIQALQEGKVRSAALDVFEREPLAKDDPLRAFSDRLVFGSHNASNTSEAVRRTSVRAIEKLNEFLGGRT